MKNGLVGNGHLSNIQNKIQVQEQMKHPVFHKSNGSLQSLLPLLRDLVGEDLHPPAKVVDLAVAQGVELAQVLADQLPDAALEHLVAQLLLPRRELQRTSYTLYLEFLVSLVLMDWVWLT